MNRLSFLYFTLSLNPSAHCCNIDQIKVVGPPKDVVGTWKNLIDRLAMFRQARYGGRFGRSQWPEPDAIRNITQSKNSKHRAQAIQKFPRAVFGLPIIFHFKDIGEPPDPTLKGIDDIERLASPLILRPLACRDGKAIGIALILKGPRIPPGGLILSERKTPSGKSVHEHRAETMLTKEEAKTIPLLNGETDILQAFLNYL